MLSQKSGVNKNTLYDMKNNKISRVDLDVLKKVCDALGCNLSQLMKYEPVKTSPESVVRFQIEHRREGKGKIFILSGPSGAGKNTLINQILTLDLGLHYIPSFTTREMRKGETQGDPYYFVDLDSFQNMIDNGEFLEYEKIHGNYYGTHWKSYEYAIQNGYDVIKDIDVNGALNFKEVFPGDVVLIYIRPSSLEILKDRLMMRGDDPKDIQIRLNRIQLEESKQNRFDYTVYNDDLMKAVEETRRIIESYKNTQTP
jgi:guanylate kinase